MKYEIWSNVSTGGKQFITGYSPGDTMKKSWEGDVTPGTEHPAPTLEFLFAKFNADDRPNGQIAHSLSVGDVVVLDGAAYAVAMMGFRRLEKFNPIIGDYKRE